MNKIIIHHTSTFFCCLLFLIITFPANAQRLNKYGLRVITKTREFKRSIAADTSRQMADVRNIPGIVLDLRYAQADNFINAALYPPLQTTFLRQAAVLALAAVQKELSTKGLGIKVWDAYRPYSVTEKLWEPVKDERYAANPAKGSGHNRGIAVDITLIRLDTKQELNMGTDFDNFSDTAHIDFKDLPEEVLTHRRFLKSLMERHGFLSLQSEWWHFYIPNAKDYELLDLSFSSLSKLVKKRRFQ